MQPTRINKTLSKYPKVRITGIRPQPNLNIVMDPQPTLKAIPRDNQVVDLYCLQSTGHRTSQTSGLRRETQLQLTILGR